jgi:hypothetical protein
MSKPFFQRLTIGAALMAAGAGLLAAGHPPGLAWALIVWALLTAVIAPARKRR